MVLLQASYANREVFTGGKNIDGFFSKHDARVRFDA